MAKAATALAPSDDAERMAVGGNKPPLVTLDDLAAENAAQVRDVTDLLATARELPAEITSDEEDGRVTDVVREIQTEWKRAEANRVDTKAPFLAGERTVDAFFNTALLDKLTKAKTVLESRLTVWKRKKADQERRRREEEARIAREEADRLRAEAERLRQEAESAAQREREEAALAEAFDERPAPIAAPSLAPVKAAEDAALDAAYEARMAEKAVEAKPADLTRNRSESGKAASTLVESWLFEITDINAIPLDTLRVFIPRADIEKAVRRYVAIHKADKPLAGVRIYPEEKARVY